MKEDFPQTGKCRDDANIRAEVFLMFFGDSSELNLSFSLAGTMRLFEIRQRFFIRIGSFLFHR